MCARHTKVCRCVQRFTVWVHLAFILLFLFYVGNTRYCIALHCIVMLDFAVSLVENELHLPRVYVGQTVSEATSVHALESTTRDRIDSNLRRGKTTR